MQAEAGAAGPVPKILRPWVGVVGALGVGIIFWLTVEPTAPSFRLLQASLVLGYVVVISTVARYRYTLFLLTMAITLAGWLLEVTQEPFIVATWALYRAAFLTRNRRYFFPALAIVSALLAVTLITGEAPSSETLLLKVLMSMTLLLGGWVLGAQGRAEAEQREQATRARERNRLLEERARVARDLHDVLSHTLSRIGIQAGVAAELDGGSDSKAVETLRGIETASRDALHQVRDVIANVRTNPHNTGPALADITDMITESRQAGIDIAAHIDVPGDASTSVNQHLYHVIQEIVTNIGKHATNGAGELWIDQDDESLRVRSTNRSDPNERRRKTGLGLIGIQERVTLLDGTCQISDNDGTFAIEVACPSRSLTFASRDGAR